jgi:2-hydroxychromene-2-carboxylate isomerase
MEPVDVVHYTDPACPWAYSSEPFFTALRYRYGDGLRWRTVMIGLAETAEDYVRRGYKPDRRAQSNARFGRRFGMPMLHAARSRMQGTGRACRAFKSAERQGDALAQAFLRELRFGWFCTVDLLDEDEGIRAAAGRVPGLDPDAVVAGIGDPEVEAAYQADKAEARSASETGTPAVLQDKTANTDGALRFTAPSLVFSRGGERLVAGGWQSLEAYDVCVANLAPDLERRAEPAPEDLLATTPFGVTTEEVARACTHPLEDCDRVAVEERLLELAFAGTARRRPLGDDALWLPA